METILNVKKINLVITPITNVDYDESIILDNTLLEEINKYYSEMVTIFNSSTARVEKVNFANINENTHFIIKNDMLFKIINKF